MTGSTVPSGAARVTTDLDVAALAMRISDPDRTRSILVVSIPPGAGQPLVDADMLHRDLPDLEVRVIGADWTKALANHLGADASVYAGAVRIYPAGEHPNAGYLWLPAIADSPRARAHRITSDLTPPAPDTPHPAGRGLAEITNPTQADALATHLLDPTRSRPVVLVSVPVGHHQPWADMTEIRATVGEQCDVVVLHTGVASRAFAARLPRGCEAFGGAGRVYPVGTAWLADWDQAPLRFAYDPDDGATQTRLLIRDALRASIPTHTSTATPAPARQRADGTVLGIAAGRGMVRLDDTTLVTIWPETIAADLDADQLLTPGMHVTGDHQADTRRLDVCAMRVDAAQALAGYRLGDQVLARVADVDDHTLHLDLLPGVRIAMTHDQITTSSLSLRSLVSPGEILVVRITGRDPWTLSLDVDDTEPLQPAPAILTGGPAWLTAPVPGPEVHPTAQGPQETVDDDQTDLAPAWEHERAQLLDELQRSRQKASRAKAELRETRTRLREATQGRERVVRELAALQEAAGRVAPDEALFTDPVEQFRFEVLLAWARRIPAADKATWPLQSYTLGPQFLATVDQVQGIDRAKIVDVVVEVCTGLAADLDGRELHQLRTGEAGNAPTRVREDGAVAWRVALQRGTAGARRLHFWRCPDQMIELSSIRHHDDMRP